MRLLPWYWLTRRRSPLVDRLVAEVRRLLTGLALTAAAVTSATGAALLGVLVLPRVLRLGCRVRLVDVRPGGVALGVCRSWHR